MIHRIADNIVCPLGEGSEEVYRALKSGRLSTGLHDGADGGIEPYFASVFDQGAVKPVEGMTAFESLMARSVEGALAQLEANGFRDFDPSSSRVLFIVSTTKGNISLLRPEDGFSKDRRLLLAYSASVLTRHFSNPNRPVVVSNACISGLSAQIVADRQLASGRYDFAIVTGADLLCPFIISGFQSFKALSSERARSFDASRSGLNLGEAAATVIYASPQAAGRVGEAARIYGKYVAFADGAIANDANHISAPSRTGEGLFRTLSFLRPVLEKHRAGMICAHGTATAYNDSMEAVAISRASLDKIPVNSLKACIGHTLGAAGVIETILSMYQMCDGVVLPVRDFTSLGVPVSVDVVSSPRCFDGDAFIKTVSGFGGCNASAVFLASRDLPVCDWSSCGGLCRDGQPPQDCHEDARVVKDISLEVSGTEVNDIFRRSKTDYPKFFKMDMLCRLGIAAARELLGEAGEGVYDDAAIILCGSHASLDDDVKYMATIAPGNYYPSPALFVYTLANIVAGEIAIRYGMHGETTCYAADSYDRRSMEEEAAGIIGSGRASKVVFGWIDWYDGQGRADLSLMERI